MVPLPSSSPAPSSPRFTPSFFRSANASSWISRSSFARSSSSAHAFATALPRGVLGFRLFPLICSKTSWSSSGVSSLSPGAEEEAFAGYAEESLRPGVDGEEMEGNETSGRREVAAGRRRDPEAARHRGRAQSRVGGHVVIIRGFGSARLGEGPRTFSGGSPWKKKWAWGGNEIAELEVK